MSDLPLFDRLFERGPSKQLGRLFSESGEYNGTACTAIVEEESTLQDRDTEYRAQWESLTVEVSKTVVPFPKAGDTFVRSSGRKFVWSGSYEDLGDTWCLEFRRDKPTRFGTSQIPMNR